MNEKERRKRRSAKDVEESIINAANQLIKEKGFSGLTATGIMRTAEIEPIQFYKRYKDLDEFIDEYVKRYDYWFKDVVKVQQNQTNEEKERYSYILTGLFHSLLKNKIMQELLKWELSHNNETSQRTAKLRELHTLPLCQKYGNIFSDTGIDIVAISALIIGGIYYLILHNDLSPFSGIDLKSEVDIQRMSNAINHLSEILFTEHPIRKNTIEIALRMKKDNVPTEKISSYTDLPKQTIEDL